MFRSTKIAGLIGLVCVLFAPASFGATAVVVAVAAGAAAAPFGAAVAIAVGMAAFTLTYTLTMKPPTFNHRQNQQEMKQLVRTPRSPKMVSFGEVFTSGTLLLVEEQTNDGKNEETGYYDEYLYMVVGLCDHEIDSYSQLYLNETPVEDFGSKVVYEVHNNDPLYDEYLVGKAPSYTTDMTGEEVTWLRLAMRFDRDLFANGVPTPKLQYKGYNKVYDYRDETYKYSTNAALVIMTLITDYMGVDRDRVITSGYGSVIDAANLCDETVTNPDGSTSARYTINGSFNQSEKIGDVISDMLSACGGQLVRIGGSVGILPAAYYGVASFTLTEDDIVGELSVQVEPAYGEQINTVTGSFVDPDQGFVDTDYPPVVDADRKSFDGKELTKDMSFRFVTDVYQAQRLADIYLKRQLSSGTIVVNTNMKGLYCRIGRVINLEVATYDISGEYRVVGYSENPFGDSAVTLTLARDDVSIYDDAIGEVFTPPPFTNLPVGRPPSPTAVQFNVDIVGEVVQGVLEWQVNAPQAVSTDIRIKDYSTGAVLRVGSSVRDTWSVNGLVAGSYLAEVRTVTMTGATSVWASASFVISTPPKPDSCTISASNWNVLLVPVVNSGIPSGTLFEFKHLQDAESYTLGVPTYTEADVGLADTVFTGSTLNQGGLTPDRFQHYWVRATNSYGSSDWLYFNTGTTKDETDLLPVVTGSVDFTWLSDDVNNTFTQIDSDITTLETANTNLTQRMEVVETDTGEQQAAYEISATVNDITSSISVVTDETQSGIYMVADDFVLTSQDHTSYNEAPFVITGGQAYLKKAFINELEAVTITSSNYISGQQGYQISPDGDVEFNDGDFRGTVSVAGLEGNVGTAVGFANTLFNNYWSVLSGSRGTITVFQLTYEKQPYDREIYVELEIPQITTDGNNKDLVFSSDYAVDISPSSLSGRTVYVFDQNPQFQIDYLNHVWFTAAEYASYASQTGLVVSGPICWKGTIPATTETGTSTLDFDVRLTVDSSSSDVGQMYVQEPIAKVTITKGVTGDLSVNMVGGV